MKHTFEVEQKYKITSPEKIRTKLKGLRAKKISSDYERNFIFDLRGMLKRKKSVLRLRQFGGKGFLTFKGPRMKSKFKKRIEIETVVDFKKTESLLLTLGYQVSARYEKMREEYRLQNAHITIDHMKGFGWFVEIEGEESEILKIENRLGLGPRDREDRSYLEMVYGNKNWR